MPSTLPTFTTPRRQLLGVPDDVTGRGVCIALTDQFLPPHPDLTPGRERKVLWLDGRGDPFDPEKTAQVRPAVRQHGLGRAAVAGGSGASSGGAFAGVAPHVTLVLLNWNVARGEFGKNPRGQEDCLQFLDQHAATFGIRAVQFGALGDRTGPLVPWQWDGQRRWCERLSSKGILVVAGTGNCPGSFMPVSLAPSALAVGGLDLPVAPGEAARGFHSPEGTSFEGKPVPDCRAPAERVVVPSVATAETSGLAGVPPRHTVQEGIALAESFALGLLACLWQKHPDLDPWTTRAVLAQAARSPSSRFGGLAIGLPTWGAIEEAIQSISRLPAPPLSPYERYEAVQQMPWHERMALLRDHPEQAADLLLNSLPDRAPADQGNELVACYQRASNPRVRAAVVLLLSPLEEETRAEHPTLDKALFDDSALVLGCALEVMRRCPALARKRERHVASLINYPDGQVRYQASLVAEAAPDETYLRPLVQGMKRDLDEQNLIGFFARKRCLEHMTRQDHTPEIRKMLPGECVYSDYLLGVYRECARRWLTWFQER